MGIKIFICIYKKKEFTNSTNFVSLAKNFLCENSFYSLEEYFNFCTTYGLQYNVTEL